MSKQVICSSCGAKFRQSLPKCPYCDTLNYKGAEAEYMGRLQNLRGEVERLGDIPEQETRKELKKLKPVLFILLLIAVVVAGIVGLKEFLQRDEFETDSKEDIVWQKEMFPIFDELYNQEDYEKLLELFNEALIDGKAVYEWKHASFCYESLRCQEINELLDQEAAGVTMEEYDEVFLLNAYWHLRGLSYGTELSEGEQKRLQPYVDECINRVGTRWNFSDEQQAEFEKQLKINQGIVPYDLCEEYIKQWMKGK